VVADGREYELDEREKNLTAREKQLAEELDAVYTALSEKPDPNQRVNFGYSSANFIYASRNDIAEKESEVKDMYQTQKDLNQLYETEVSNHQDLRWLHTALSEELEEAEKTISHLEASIATLRDDLNRARGKYQNELETLSSASETHLAAVKNDMAKVIANMAMAIGSAKYSDGKYQISHLSEPEGRFIDAISNYAEDWLDEFGCHELSEKVRTEVSVSQGIQDHVKVLEPKVPKISRGLSR